MCNEFDISLSGSRVRQSGSSPRSVCVTPLGSRLTVHPSQPLTRRRPSAFITTAIVYSQALVGSYNPAFTTNHRRARSRRRTTKDVCRFGGGGLGGHDTRGRFVVSSVCTSSITIPYSRRRARGPGGGREGECAYRVAGIKDGSTVSPSPSELSGMSRDQNELKDIGSEPTHASLPTSCVRRRERWRPREQRGQLGAQLLSIVLRIRRRARAVAAAALVVSA